MFKNIYKLNIIENIQCSKDTETHYRGEPALSRAFSRTAITVNLANSAVYLYSKNLAGYNLTLRSKSVI